MKIIKTFPIKPSLEFSRNRFKFLGYLRFIALFVSIIYGLFLLYDATTFIIDNPDPDNVFIIVMSAVLVVVIFVIIWQLYINMFSQKRKLIITEDGVIFTYPKSLYKWNRLKGFKVDGQKIILLNEMGLLVNDPVLDLGENCQEAASILSKYLQIVG